MEDIVNHKIYKVESKDEALHLIRVAQVHLCNLEEEYRDDMEIVAHCCKRYPFDIEFASEKLRANRNFMLKLIELYPRTISYASKEVRDDDNVRKIAFKNGCFIVNLDALKIFSEYDSKLASATTPNIRKKVKYEDLNMAEMEQFKKKSIESWEKFLELGKILISSDYTFREKEAKLYKYLVFLNKCTGAIQLKVNRYKYLYENYLKLQALYLNDQALTPNKVKEIEKFLLERFQHETYQRSKNQEQVKDNNFSEFVFD